MPTEIISTEGSLKIGFKNAEPHNESYTEYSADHEEAQFRMVCFINGETKRSLIEGVVKNGKSSLWFVADTIKYDGVLDFEDNAAAIAGGLEPGMTYRTGDFQKIVH